MYKASPKWCTISIYYVHVYVYILLVLCICISWFKTCYYKVVNCKNNMVYYVEYCHFQYIIHLTYYIEDIANWHLFIHVYQIIVMTYCDVLKIIVCQWSMMALGRYLVLCIVCPSTLLGCHFVGSRSKKLLWYSPLIITSSMCMQPVILI